MRQGLDIMEEQFPDAETSNTIRVMFTGLPEKEKQEVLARLEALPNVGSVSFDLESGDYNAGDYTLYILNIPYDYNTDEMDAAEDALTDGFSGYYDMVYSVDDDSPASMLPMWIIALAVVIVLVVLLIMSASWLEPVLFLITIGLAIVINMGTNLILGSVSQITYSIAAILQLALSMDYSIMLMEYYSRERRDRRPSQAMKQALAKALTPVASSSITTVVGLLMLVFMSFKIGADMGIVLAKGVFISLLCVFTALPALIVLCDGGIQKTRKPVPKIPMAWMARFSHRFRYVVLGVFVVLFAGVLLLKGNTEISYTLTASSEIDEVFGKDNSIVLIYRNEDEDAVTQLAQALEQEDGVKSAANYTSSLGQSYTAAELADALAEMDSGIELDETLLELLYYEYFDAALYDMTAGNFLDFLTGQVLENETFSQYLDGDVLGNSEKLARFSNAETLTSFMTIGELAEFFELDEDTVEQLLLYYYIQYGGVSAGTMTLSGFTNFVLNEVAESEDYGSLLDGSALSELETLQTFTDASAMTRVMDCSSLAALLGLDEDGMALVFIYYYASSSYDPGTLTLTEFIQLANAAAADETLGAYFDEASLAQLASLSQLTDPVVLQTPMGSQQVAAVLGLDETLTEQLFQLYALQSAQAEQAETEESAQTEETEEEGSEETSQAEKTEAEESEETAQAEEAGAETVSETLTMSLWDFVSFLEEDILSNPLYAAYFDEAAQAQLDNLYALMGLALSGESYSYSEMAQIVEMDEDALRLLYTYGAAQTQLDTWRLSPRTAVNFLVSQGDAGLLTASQLSQLTTLQSVIESAVAGTAYTPAQLAQLLGMEKAQARQVLLLYISAHGDISGWGMSAQSFLGFLVDDVLMDEDLSGQFTQESAQKLAAVRTLVDAVVSGTAYNAQEMSQLFSGLSEEMDEETTELLYLYYASANYSDSAWFMTLTELLEFISVRLSADDRFSPWLDQDLLDTVEDARQQLADAAAQLQGSDYSRLVLTTTLPMESEETTAFLDELNQALEDGLAGDYYLIGNSPMAWKMAQSFDAELNKITLLTALAIFLVVLISFRSLAIPVLLVLLIQTAVYATMVIMNLQGQSMYYLALLIVQSILMGATIDYGILFTNYYRTNRRSMGMKASLLGAYASSIQTILTSGLIIVLATAILGYAFSDLTIRQICHTIAKGAACSILLILFVLPGVLASFDRLVTGRRRKKE
ncbi:MAG: efflux RND transporter permease subunit [Oscillospiraceae bacterium]|nr:efflux RND transporter permease subunit [Oscillospiraceae bacterium]